MRKVTLQDIEVDELALLFRSIVREEIEAKKTAPVFMVPALIENC